MIVDMKFQSVVTFLRQLEASLASGVNAELHVVGKGFCYDFVRSVARFYLKAYYLSGLWHNQQMVVYFSGEKYKKIEGSDRVFAIADSTAEMGSILRDLQTELKDAVSVPPVVMLFVHKKDDVPPK